ncbi:serine hydrolase domain-containing protein [Aequorivita antarctica]|uniref:Beta-lactamase family protein n=1 Tax=Aequorivita antarctica TaxID=153266 RepID=A0A5C6Z007_9FLAO|nr:serine hydrolase domain-containing protein [Aequorivita antarctica]TXD73269.1 beta-lactamase family protein [Aequorivita antarctica]SRX76022.1 D-alanyl-D-alanine carboxypeptidase [Aequorivita antarctica]
MKSLLNLFFGFVFLSSQGQETIKFADSIRQEYKIPEISYAVINDTSILEIEAIGQHSISVNDQATLEDRFHLGSNTKAMTAFIVAKYIEKKKLNWNTKFFKIFPEWKKESNKDYYNITLQDLLSHRAGIQPFQGIDDPQIPDFKGENKEKRKLFGKFVLTLEPTKMDSINNFVYSNADYTLAALMLEKVTHKSWEELVEKVFNEDLKLNVGFSWPDNQEKKDTWGHYYENNQLVAVPSNADFHLDYTEPAGDLNIKLKDYIKFIQLNLDGLQGHDNYLQSRTYNFLHNGIKNYSLGWFNIMENGQNWSTHSGTVGTYYTNVQIDKTNKIAYIIFANAYSEDTVKGVRILMRKLKEEYTKEIK